jgi:hypothetical protein
MEWLHPKIAGMIFETISSAEFKIFAALLFKNLVLNDNAQKAGVSVLEGKCLRLYV